MKDKLTINFNIACSKFKEVCGDDEYIAGLYDYTTDEISVYLETYHHKVTIERIIGTLIHEFMHWAGAYEEYTVHRTAEKIKSWLVEPDY